MLYLSRIFHLQHNYINRCLNGFVISLFFVVMSGCENIRYNTISESGNKTLFYFASSSDEVNLNRDQSLETPIDDYSAEKLLVDAAFDNENLNSHSEIEESVLNQESIVPLAKDSSEMIAESGSGNDLKQPTELIKIDANKVVSEGKAETETSILDSGLTEWMSSLFSSDPQESEGLVDGDDDTILIEDDNAYLTVKVMGDKHQALDPLPISNISDDALVAQINALNKSEPTAAGTKPNEVTQQVYAEKDAQRLTEKMSQQLKRASKIANLEIFQWQLEMQKAAHNRIDCRLSSPTIQLDSPNYTTQLWFTIENNRLIVNATTDIDPMLPLVGLYLENGGFEKFLSKKHSHYVAWEGDIEGLLIENRLIKLVISGNDLQSEIQLAAINLASLKSIYPKYQSCTKRLLGRAE